MAIVGSSDLVHSRVTATYSAIKASRAACCFCRWAMSGVSVSCEEAGEREGERTLRPSRSLRARGTRPSQRAARARASRGERGGRSDALLRLVLPRDDGRVGPLPVGRAAELSDEVRLRGEEQGQLDALKDGLHDEREERRTLGMCWHRSSVLFVICCGRGRESGLSSRTSEAAEEGRTILLRTTGSSMGPRTFQMPWKTQGAASGEDESSGRGSRRGPDRAEVETDRCG